MSMDITDWVPDYVPEPAPHVRCWVKDCGCAGTIHPRLGGRTTERNEEMSGEEMRCSRRGCSCGGFIHPGIPVRGQDLGREIIGAEKRLERLYARAARLEAWGGPEEYENGTVLIFDRTFPTAPTLYSYAAIKAGGLWYVTGAKAGADGISHNRLIEEFLDPADSVWIVTEAEQL